MARNTLCLVLFQEYLVGEAFAKSTALPLTVMEHITDPSKA